MRNSLPLVLDSWASGQARIHIEPAHTNGGKSHEGDDYAGGSVTGERIAEEHAQGCSRDGTEKGGQGEVAQLHGSQGRNIIEEAKGDAGHHPERGDR